MELLKQRILRDGKNLGSGILKVDRFINHQADPQYQWTHAGWNLPGFLLARAQKVLTAEISGHRPALMAGKYLHIPVVYARKSKPITMPHEVYLTVAPSHTKGNNVELIVSPEYLGRDERIVIIDDFLASGATIAGLVRLAQVAGAQVVGIGTLIEKSFEGGRNLLSYLNIPIHSLVTISSMDAGGIVFAD